MEAASARVRLAVRTGSRPDEARIEVRGVAAYAAEGIGTFLLVFFICAVISVGNANVLQLDLAGLGMLHALTLGVLVYALAASSGADFNPAITVAQLAIRQIRARDAAAYIVFQLAGGALAGLGLAVMVFGPATGAGLNPARWLGPAHASGSYADFWIYIVGPIAGALFAAFGYGALVLSRQPNKFPQEVSE